VKWGCNLITIRSTGPLFRCAFGSILKRRAHAVNVRHALRRTWYMLNRVLFFLPAARRLRAVERFLGDWCPRGVSVINDGRRCWLHYGGMIYSLPYDDLPSPEHVPYMTTHLENHKWCMKLAGGVYTRRSLLEAWVNNYLPDAAVIGASGSDIIYPDEKNDRPIHKGEHTHFTVTHKSHFVLHATMTTSLPSLAADIIKKTRALGKGEDIYFYPPPMSI